MAKPHVRFLTIVPNFYIKIAKLKLLNHHGFDNHARARRFFSAQPDKAFSILSGL